MTTAAPPTTDDVALLLVDDVAENLVALEAALAPLGHRMVRARSGEEALRHLLREDDFAAIVLDVQMPGLDGFQTAEAIRRRERSNRVPILFLTAISRDEDHRLKGFAAGAVDYIFKPVDPDVLRAKVSVFVELYLKERQLRAQQEQLRQRGAELARSNADLEQFASVVSHDLQEPLHVIAGHLELLSERLGDGLDGESRVWIDRMLACAERMSGLLNDLLALSRMTADRREPAVVPLGDALSDALANLERSVTESGTRVRVPRPLPSAVGSRRELGQVFQNVVGNAIRHRGDHPPTVEVTAEESDGLVTVSVSDDGPGVPVAQMERVFGLFERAGEQPRPTSGLGLAICRKIVTRLGGRIWMEPRPGGGVTVRFALPAGA